MATVLGGSFETGSEGWIGIHLNPDVGLYFQPATNTYDPANARTGQRALQFTEDALALALFLGAPSSFPISTDYPQKPVGGPFEFRVWGKSPSGGVFGATVDAGYTNGGSVRIGDAAIVGATYQELVISSPDIPATIEDEFGSFALEAVTIQLVGDINSFFDDWYLEYEVQGETTSTFCRDNGVWKPSDKYVKDNGIWKPAATTVKHSNAWKDV